MFFTLSILGVKIFAQTASLQPAYDVIKRTTGTPAPAIDLSVDPSSGDCFFEYHVAEGRLKVKANSPVSLCKGVYDYLKTSHSGLYSWSGSSLRLPRAFNSDLRKRVVSPFSHHYYLNVCTFGYTMAYWDWARWEKEIDWMALHGIDMPLAYVGYEAIISRVWKKMGLSDAGINGFFTGPAHLPWLEMGNISKIDGPLNEAWYKRQIALQHKILNRMRELGMKPICPAFAGYVPAEFKEKFPKSNILVSKSMQFFTNNMLSPYDPLFARILTEYIKEWEKEFGACEYYQADSFNEVDIPFPPKGSAERAHLFATYGENVYRAIKAGNPNAVWTMQGWMFGYQKDIWDYATLEALVSRVPQDKLLIVDLAVDYNKNLWKIPFNWDKFRGFFGKPWIYSVIPNMGGRCGLSGIMEFYANGHLTALNSPYRGNLVAFGFAPEGIENNEVLFELLTDVGWTREHTDIHEWLRNYSINRYGKTTPQLEKFWEYLLQSVYGTFTHRPLFNWQQTPSPFTEKAMNLNDAYFKAFETFMACSKDLGNSRLYQTDMLEYMAMYLGGKAELLIRMIENEYVQGNTVQAKRYEEDFERLLLGIDQLLTKHPNMRFEKWIARAKEAAVGDAQKAQYETNARRILTIWGPPLPDYAARLWSGLVRDYYLVRWKNYFEGKRSGIPYDDAAFGLRFVTERTPLSRPIIPKHPEALARELMSATAYITPEKAEQLIPKNLAGSWNSPKTGETREIIISTSPQELRKLKGFKFQTGGGTFELKSIRLLDDGREIVLWDNPRALPMNWETTIPVTIPDHVQGNNSCELRISFYGNRSKGKLYIVEK